MIDRWTMQSAAGAVHDFGALSAPQQAFLVDRLNENFPPTVYEEHRRRRGQALVNAQEARKVLNGARQEFPALLKSSEMAQCPGDLRNCAVVLTAGGDGERLKTSLRARGVREEDLKDFTKATYPLPGFHGGFGALQANLCLVASLGEKLGIDIPVVVTTGPAGSVTARVIPAVIKAHGQFGLKRLVVVPQQSRLHLTIDNKIAYALIDSMPMPATHPDETGGPLMELKRKNEAGQSVLSRLSGLGCDKIILLQATGLYEPSVLLSMASALGRHDCVGVGILRTEFSEKDPFGAYVAVKSDKGVRVVIVESGIRNATTMALKDASGRYFLPCNTGLYAFNAALLVRSDLPDYATPPKEVLPGLPRSPKIGFAATDIFTLAEDPAVLCIPEGSFEVIKNAGDLEKLSALGKKWGIDALCGES